MTRKTLKQETLNKAWRNWYFWHGSSQQAETMLGNAVGHAMAPVIEELYSDNKEERIKAYKRSLTLFNTEQQVGAICPGLFCGMEEANVNGELNEEVMQAVKVGLIGPTSAIGDSLWVATIIPLLITICMSITNFGGTFYYVGPLLYAIGYPILTAIISKRLWNLGYKAGLEGVHQFMHSGTLDILTKAMTVLGLLVVGALTASNVSVFVPVMITPPGGETAAINLDALINQIFPGILGLLLTLYVYRLYTKKNVSPLKIMALVLVISIILTALGYLTGVYA